MIKKILRNILRFLGKASRFFVYAVMAARAPRTNILKYMIRKEGNKRFAVIATGPSLKEDVSYITDPEYLETTDFLMLNFSAFDSLFFQLKPKHYCLADPMYFSNSWRDEEVFRFFKLINEKVDWTMNIYIPASNYKNFLFFSHLTNCHINVVGVNTIVFQGFECLRYYFYKKGLASPPPQTVTNLGIFIGIQNGYPDVDLFGVDHTFLSDLMINENNKLCQKYYHSYDKEKPQYKVIVRTDTNEVWKIGEYIVACGKMFLSHDMLEKYAKSVSCKIVNHTKCSMIDSYERYKG